MSNPGGLNYPPADETLRPDRGGPPAAPLPLAAGTPLWLLLESDGRPAVFCTSPSGTFTFTTATFGGSA